MLSEYVLFDRKPEAVAVMLLPDGMADVWIRRGIGSDSSDSETAYTKHYAEKEAYARMDSSEVSPEVINKNPEEWFRRIADWEPDRSTIRADKTGGIEDELQALRQEVTELTGQVGTVKEALLKTADLSLSAAKREQVQALFAVAGEATEAAVLPT